MSLTLGLPEGTQEGLRSWLCILGPLSHQGERAGLCLSCTGQPSHSSTSLPALSQSFQEDRAPFFPLEQH